MPVFGVRSLGAASARISQEEAERIAAEHWGLGGVAKELPGEADENFRLASDAGTFLLKVGPPDEGEELTDLVTRAMMHAAARAETVEVQNVLRAKSGEPVVVLDLSDGGERRARMTTFIEGQMLRTVPTDPELRRRVGAALGGLALALRDFDHPAVGRELSWDLRHAGKMGAMLAELGEGEGLDALRACLEDFDAAIVPRLDRLPVQVVHNDLSKDNVVVADDGRLGVIDFGDVVRTQRINDLAVAMVDHLQPGPRPLGQALDVVRGYLEVAPLRGDEVEMLYELVRVRVVTRLVGGEWRTARFPENRAYLGRNLERAWEVFASLPAQPPAEDAAELAAIAEGAD